MDTMLRKEISHLSTVFDQIKDGVYITDPDRRILFWNKGAEEITGYSKEEVLGKKCADNLLVHSDLAGNKLCSTDLCPLHKAISCQEASEEPLIVKALHKNGSRVMVEVSLAPLYSASGELVGGIEIFRDVSEKIELEEQKARFFSSLSHELKTPLSNMQGYLKLLLDGDAGEINDLQEEFLTTIYKEEQKLARYIEELLDMGQFEGTDYSYQRSLLDLTALLEDLANSFSAEALNKELNFNSEIESDLALFGDRERLSQAFSNLIGNAIKYTEQGSVSLKAVFSEADDEIVITVQDSGIGIPEKDQRAIFEMFYRVEDKDVRSKGGTGVGLYIAERVISRHGGRIELESIPGEGTTFTVYLPGFIKSKE